MKDKTIIQLWKHNGELTPFAVRRNSWAKGSYLMVHEIRVGRFPYGDVSGIYFIHGKQKSKIPEPVSCAGCYQWEIVDAPEAKRGVYKGKKRKLRIYEKTDHFDFGKYYHPGIRQGLKTIGEVFEEDPSYIKWCLKNVEAFCLVPEQLQALNPTDPESRIGGKLRKINHERYESLVPNKSIDGES